MVDYTSFIDSVTSFLKSKRYEEAKDFGIASAYVNGGMEKIKKLNKKLFIIYDPKTIVCYKGAELEVFEIQVNSKRVRFYRIDNKGRTTLLDIYTAENTKYALFMAREFLEAGCEMYL